MDNTKKTDEEWKQKLTPEQYHILREKGTETPYTGKYLNNHETGMYQCAACGQPLFSSDAKFEDNTGWPAFDKPENSEHIILQPDDSYGMHRTEVICKNCGSHLGHLFDDGPTETGQHFCINSCALDFKRS